MNGARPKGRQHSMRWRALFETSIHSRYLNDLEAQARTIILAAGDFLLDRKGTSMRCQEMAPRADHPVAYGVLPTLGRQIEDLLSPQNLFSLAKISFS